MDLLYIITTLLYITTTIYLQQMFSFNFLVIFLMTYFLKCVLIQLNEHYILKC